MLYRCLSNNDLVTEKLSNLKCCNTLKKTSQLAFENIHGINIYDFNLSKYVNIGYYKFELKTKVVFGAVVAQLAKVMI